MAKRWIVKMYGPCVGTTETIPVIYDDHVTEEMILRDYLDEAIQHYEQWLEPEDFEDDYYDESEASSNYHVEPYDPEEHDGTWIGDWHDYTSEGS